MDGHNSLEEVIERLATIVQVGVLTRPRMSTSLVFSFSVPTSSFEGLQPAPQKYSCTQRGAKVCKICPRLTLLGSRGDATSSPHELARAVGEAHRRLTLVNVWDRMRYCYGRI